MNPLIEKFEEVYGKKPKEGGLIEQLAEEQLGAAGGTDYISFGNVGDTVIPTAEVTPTGINLTGGYVNSNLLVSNGITCVNPNTLTHCVNPNTLTSNTKSFCLPNQTSVEQQFNKVLDDVAHSRATVASISAEIDSSFTGFGGQIKYTVEIVGTYP